MRVAISISSLPQMVTNQLVGVSVAEELERRGHHVDIYFIGQTSRERIRETFGISLRAQLFGKRWFWPPGTTIYDYPAMAILMGGHKGYDLTFEAIGPVIHLSRSRMADVTYVYFPPDPDLMGNGKFRKGFWRLYSLPYQAFYSVFVRNIHYTRLLTISSYIAELCKAAWGMDSEVVYFPVPYEEWLPKFEPQRDGVVTLGRFSAEKNQAEQIRIAEELRRSGIEQPFRIVGAAATAINARLLANLKKEAGSRNLRNVWFYPNLPRKEVISMAQKSKVFLHTMRNEHFGIATVEAIAAGCVPIVHDSGGSRDIVPIEALRFRTSEDAIEKVRSALDGSFDDLLPDLRRHISSFSVDSFQKRVADILMSEVKRHGAGIGTTREFREEPAKIGKA